MGPSMMCVTRVERSCNVRVSHVTQVFVTTGMLLRWLVGDENLDDVTHIIVDEIHERIVVNVFCWVWRCVWMCVTVNVCRCVSLYVILCNSVCCYALRDTGCVAA